MSARARYEDLSTVLYMVPFIGGIGYAIALWVQNGASLILPSSVYLTVSRDPTLFIVASLSILLGIMIEVNSTEPSGRPAKLVSLGGTLQSIAAASLVLALLSAWYANGFTDLGGAAADLIVGRYGLVFPAIMVLLSYLLTARFRAGALADRRVIAIILMLLVPASLYEIGRRQIAVGLLVALALLVAGAAMYVLPQKKQAPAEKR